jgi:hypothetical protein
MSKIELIVGNDINCDIGAPKNIIQDENIFQGSVSAFNNS